MRDHRRLRVFELCHELVLVVYEATKRLPRTEIFGLSSQLRRGATSAATNIAEGAAHGDRELNRYLEISLGSLREVGYLVRLAAELGYLDSQTHERLSSLQERCSGALGALLRSRGHWNGRHRSMLGRPRTGGTGGARQQR
jgi:four helix bundle protein